MSPPEIKYTPDDLPPDEYHGHPFPTPPARPDPPKSEAVRLTRELADTYAVDHASGGPAPPAALSRVLGIIAILAGGAAALWMVGRAVGVGYFL